MSNVRKLREEQSTTADVIEFAKANADSAHMIVMAMDEDGNWHGEWSYMDVRDMIVGVRSLQLKVDDYLRDDD